MANSFFQFKQFRIEQDRCAMKVTTDGCLFGAILLNFLPQMGEGSTALDIGAGTGLLSLMLAQEQPRLNIRSVEIDPGASAQAGENFASSPWKEKLESIHCDLLNYEPGLSFDLIVTNPPFYENDLPSPDRKINLARHNNELSLSLLMQRIGQLMKEEGEAWILLPYKRHAEIRRELSFNSLVMERIFFVKQTEKHDPFRIILQVRKREWITKGPVVEEFIINGPDGNYTTAFQKLLSPFYLRL